jgi:LCP family protein required for cell wall assembly
MSTLKKVLLILLLMAVLGSAVGIFMAVKMFQAYSPSEPKWQTTMRAAFDPRSLFPGKNDLYILVLGTDFNYTDKDIMYTKNTRSDTMMLFHLDLNNKTVKQMSIPRDTRVYIPGDCYKGDCYDKINAAFAVGGPKLSEQVVTALTGIPIDYYVRIKEAGLKNLVDAIGGIDVNVDEDMNYDDNWGHLHIHLKKGFQHLNGEQAAEFARFRHDPLGDYGRMMRQQEVIKAIAKKLENPLILEHLNSIVEVAKANVETDLTFQQILGLANLFKGIRLADLKTYNFPTVPKDIFEFGDWVSYVVPVPDQDKQVLEEFTSDEPASSPQAGSVISVEVLNGSGVPGMAQEVAEKLRSEGFSVARVGNADNFNYQKTEILDHTGKGDGLAVAKYFNPNDVETLSVPQNPQNRSNVDVTVIVGKEQPPQF